MKSVPQRILQEGQETRLITWSIGLHQPSSPNTSYTDLDCFAAQRRVLRKKYISHVRDRHILEPLDKTYYIYE